MAKKVLVITDAQNEFITGALGNKECEAAVKNIIAAAESGEYYKVIFTKDTHTADYLHTQEGKRLPVLHGQKRIKALIPILVPLFISAIRRAYDLATAMEARCYRGGKGRTKMKPLKYSKKDGLAYIILFAYLGLIIAARILWNKFVQVG